MVNPIQILSNPSANNGGIFYSRPLLTVFFLLLGIAAFAQPHLQLTESKKNFGFVKRGTVVTTTFEITNTGTSPLLITEAEVACSCTSVDFPKQPVLPAQKIVVTITFNTTTVYGRQDRTVLLKSNDPKGPHKLRFKATVSRN